VTERKQVKVELRSLSRFVENALDMVMVRTGDAIVRYVGPLGAAGVGLAS
jgi:hypothetical protein